MDFIIKKLSKFMDDETKERAIFILAQIKKNKFEFDYIKYNQIFDEIINKSNYDPNIINIKQYNFKQKNFINKEYPYSYKIFLNFKDDMTKILNSYNVNKKEILDFNNSISNFDKFCDWFNRNSLLVYDLFNYDQRFKDYINQNKNNIFDSDFKECNRLYKNPFISLRIQKYIENKIKYKYFYEDNKMSIKIFSPKKLKDNIVVEVHNIFNFMYNLFRNKFNNKFILTIYSVDLKKEIDINNSHLTSDHVNTGSTVRQRYIELWRNEELTKVLFHELVHYLGLDIRDNYDIMEKNIIKFVNFKEGTTVIPNEAYTEFIGLILTNLYNSIKIKNSNPKLKNSDIFESFMNLELYWSLFQVAKVINFYKCFDQYNSIFKKSSCKIKQSTSVFSYYIIKSSLLFNFNIMINFLVDINNPKFHYLNFQENSNNIKNFTNYIKQFLKNDEYNKLIDKFIIIFKKRYKSGSNIFNSGRMTINDLNY